MISHVHFEWDENTKIEASIYKLKPDAETIEFCLVNLRTSEGSLQIYLKEKQMEALHAAIEVAMQEADPF